MTPRRSRLALLLVVAVTALALSAAGEAASDRAASRRHGNEAFAVQTPRADELAVLPGGVDRREPGSDRSSKRRVALLALAIALVVLPLSSGRRAVVSARSVRLLASSWSPESARAPPTLRF
jgi:hypothetical protein